MFFLALFVLEFLVWACLILLNCRARNALASQGKYDEADPLFVRAIAIQEKTLGPDDLNLASSLGSRAELLISQVGKSFQENLSSLCT